jgi:transcriptional regulator with XRE-family HTH domain
LPQITRSLLSSLVLDKLDTVWKCTLWHSHNSMATNLAPVDSREVVRCDYCHLVQFRTNNNLCRKCKVSLDEEPEPVIVQAPPVPMPMRHGHSQIQVASAIRTLRQRNGMSQRQLAARMNVPRTYVSKIENEKATPTLSSMERLATALGVTVPDLLSGANSREDEIKSLMSDPFIAEMMMDIHRLNLLQMSQVLTQVRDMTLHPRRMA